MALRGPEARAKTTLVLQLLQESGLASTESLYVTVDHPRVNAMRLYDIAEAFAKIGGKLLVIDEIHKQNFSRWSK